MTRRIILPALVLAVVAYAIALGTADLVLGAPSAAADRPDLGGSWELDADLSDDPMEKLREAREGRFGRGGMGGGSRGGRGGLGGRSGGPGGPIGGGGRRPGMGGDRSPEQMRARFADLMGEGAARIEIAHAEPTLSVTYEDGRQRSFTTDGERASVETAAGAAEVRARWKQGPRLVIETESGDWRQIETYELAADGALLTVTVEIAGGPMGGVEVRRLYRPAAPAAAPAVTEGS